VSNKVSLWQPGDPITAARLNQLVDNVNALQQGVRPAQQLFPQKKVVSGRVLQLKVVSVQGDYLSCYSYDGTTTGTTLILVAKPYLLRKSLASRDSKTYSAYSTDGQERTATKTPDTENQIIVQKWIANDIIYAIQNIYGGTGIFDAEGNSIPLLDLNVDGRMWAKKST